MRIGRFDEASKGQEPLHSPRQEAENAPHGVVVSRWGWVMQVDSDVVRPSSFESYWRRRGDPKADAVVRLLGLGPGVDALQAIEAYLEEHPRDEWDEAIKDFVDECWRAPPESVAAHRTSADGKPIFTSQAAIEEGNRFAPPTLDQGQAVYWRYIIEIATSLMHGSLAAGFTSARLLATLAETGYLTGRNRNATYRRLLETSQMIIDAMRDMTPVTSVGWRSVIRVRLLHATVRVRILEGRGAKNKYDIERNGIPINQEDLCATLAAFCIVPIWALRRYGVGLTTYEEAAYIACWRHIGYYMGIELQFLERHFGRSVSTAEKFMATSAWHLFDTEDPPPGSDPYDTTTMRVLEAISERPPQPSQLDFHVEMSRITLGAGLAGRLALPPVSLWHKAYTRWRIFSVRLFTTFGRHYRRGWELQRILLLQRITVSITAWQLGYKRTRFVPKRDDQQAVDYDKIGDGEAPDLQLTPAAELEIRSTYACNFDDTSETIINGSHDYHDQGKTGHATR